jgi:GT2 family glycosyltransferase
VPDISVIIPVHNGTASLHSQLAGLAAQDYRGRWEVVLVDDASTDASARLAAGWRTRVPDLRIVAHPTALGPNAARNTGARVARADRLAFCDHDDEVAPGWLAALSRALDDHPAVGGFVERETLNTSVALATRPQRHGLHDGGFGFLPYPLAANCAVRREVWAALNGFDEAYRFGSDDVEFFWRAQLAGYHLGYAPSAVVHYRLRTDLRGMIRQYYHYGRGHPQLYRSFRGRGMPASGWAAAACTWAALLGRLPGAAVSRRRRAIWLTRAALHGGRLVGSIRSRACYL